MFAVEARGRMGNLMFQWAFALATSRALGTACAMETSGLAGLFDLGGYRRVDRRAARLLRLRTLGGPGALPLVEVSNEADPAATIRDLRDRVRYGGYFQSWDYFRGHEAAVRHSMTFSRGHRDRFDARYGELSADGYVCVHVRRGDYLSWRGGVALPWNYVRAALDCIDQPRLPVVFVSDEMPAVRAEFADLDSARFESNDPAVDLQLMTHAKHVVTSNSSFAWWGAWLGMAPGRRVLAPRHWLGFRDGAEWPSHVVPGEWETVDVPTAESP
jgi:hypothetical protein